MRGLTHARTRLEVPVEALDAIPWGALTPSALLLLAVLLIFRGDVVPRRTVERELAAKDAEIATWRKAYETEGEQSRVLTETNRVLSVEVGATVTKVMDALQERSQRGADHE